jgi:outer membrane biosynthesis protein TonB
MREKTHSPFIVLLGLVCLAARAQEAVSSGNADTSPQSIASRDTSTTQLEKDDRVPPCPAEFTLPSLPEGIFRVGGDILEPIQTKTSEASLSDEARAFIKKHHIKQFQAMSIVGVTVDTAGIPQDICVLRKAGYGLDRKALESVAEYRFKPGTLHGKPVPVRLAIGVRFDAH